MWLFGGRSWEEWKLSPELSSEGLENLVRYKMLPAVFFETQDPTKKQVCLLKMLVLTVTLSVVKEHPSVLHPYLL